MAKLKLTTTVNEPIIKKTSQSCRNPKMGSMNKSKKRSFKRYRGQGR